MAKNNNIPIVQKSYLAEENEKRILSSRNSSAKYNNFLDE